MRVWSRGTLLCLLGLVAACGPIAPRADEGAQPAQSPESVDQSPAESVDQSPAEAAKVAPPWSYDPNATYAEGDIAARMSMESIDREEAIRRFRVEDAVAGILGPTIDAWWPETFAGLWITTPPNEFGVSVAFTSDPEAKVAELRELFPFPEDVRAVQAAVPLTELLSIQRTMLDDRTDLQNGVVRSDLPPVITRTQGRYSLGTGIPTNNLVVYVEDVSDELRDAFRSTYTSRIILREGLSRPD